MQQRLDNHQASECHNKNVFGYRGIISWKI